jgi:hypothetical protein
LSAASIAASGSTRDNGAAQEFVQCFLAAIERFPIMFLVPAWTVLPAHQAADLASAQPTEWSRIGWHVFPLLLSGNAGR